MNRGFVNDWIRRSKDSPFNPGGLKEDLFLLYCRKVENSEIDPSETDSYAVVDNFYVNGDFVYAKDCSPVQWRRIRRQSIVSNDEVAILKF